MRWLLRGLVGVVFLAVVATAIGGALPGGVTEVVRRPGQVMRLEAMDTGLVWLEAARARAAGSREPAPRRLLFLPRGGRTPTVVAESPALADFSVYQDAVYYVTTDDRPPAETRGTDGPISPRPRVSVSPRLPVATGASSSPAGGLRRVALRGGAPVLLRGGLRSPNAVLALDGWVCWTEIRPRSGFSLPVLPLTRALTLLQVMPRDGGAARTLAMTDGDAEGVTLRLLGERDGALYWMEQRTLGRSGTLFKRGRLSVSGDAADVVETLSTEEGVAEGLLVGDALYWTGASREGAPARAFATVNRRLPDGRVELLADWLGTGGVPRADGNRVYYCHNGVYALPGDAGMARQIASMSAEGRLMQILRGNVYSVESEGGPEYRILRRPLDWSGRWAARRGAVP